MSQVVTHGSGLSGRVRGEVLHKQQAADLEEPGGARVVPDLNRVAPLLDVGDDLRADTELGSQVALGQAAFFAGFGDAAADRFEGQGHFH